MSANKKTNEQVVAKVAEEWQNLANVSVKDERHEQQLTKVKVVKTSIKVAKTVKIDDENIEGNEYIENHFDVTTPYRGYTITLWLDQKVMGYVTDETGTKNKIETDMITLNLGTLIGSLDAASVDDNQMKVYFENFALVNSAAPSIAKLWANSVVGSRSRDILVGTTFDLVVKEVQAGDDYETFSGLLGFYTTDSVTYQFDKVVYSELVRKLNEAYKKNVSVVLGF